MKWLPIETAPEEGVFLVYGGFWRSTEAIREDRPTNDEAYKVDVYP